MKEKDSIVSGLMIRLSFVSTPALLDSAERRTTLRKGVEERIKDPRQTGDKKGMQLSITRKFEIRSAG